MKLFSCFSHPEEEGKKAEENLSCKGNISRSRQAGRSWLRQWAWPHYSSVLQNLCDFLLVPLVHIISQINRPSSLFPDTFNHWAKDKSNIPKSTTEKLEIRRSSACQSWDRLLSAVQKLAESICTIATHSWALWWCWDGLFYYYLLVLVLCFPPKTEISLPQKTDVSWCCR